MVNLSVVIILINLGQNLSESWKRDTHLFELLLLKFAINLPFLATSFDLMLFFTMAVLRYAL